MLLANIHRDTKRHPDPYEMTEFLLGDVETFEQTPEQMAMVAELTAIALQATEREV